MKNKLLIGTSIALLLGAGTLALDRDVEKKQVEKPILDSKIDSDIVAEQTQSVSQKGTFETKIINGADGVKRTVIPYVSPDGRKGYTVVYEKTEILTDKNGSTTEKKYTQQIDYGHEGRTQLW